MAENPIPPEVNTKPNVLESARAKAAAVVDKVRSHIPEPKLALIGGAVGLAFILSACNIYNPVTTDSRGIPALGVQPATSENLSGEEDRTKIIDVLREMINPDILSKYNAVNLDPTWLRSGEMNFTRMIDQKGRIIQQRGLIYQEKDPGGDLLGRGGNKNRPTGENLYFVINLGEERFPEQRDYVITTGFHLEPGNIPFLHGSGEEGKQGLIPEVAKYIDPQMSDGENLIPLSKREAAARALINIPSDAKFGSKDDPRSRVQGEESMLTWTYDLPDGRVGQGRMDLFGKVTVAITQLASDSAPASASTSAQK